MILTRDRFSCAKVLNHNWLIQWSAIFANLPNSMPKFIQDILGMSQRQKYVHLKHVLQNLKHSILENPFTSMQNLYNVKWICAGYQLSKRRAKILNPRCIDIFLTIQRVKRTYKNLGTKRVSLASLSSVFWRCSFSKLVFPFIVIRNWTKRGEFTHERFKIETTRQWNHFKGILSNNYIKVYWKTCHESVDSSREKQSDVTNTKR